MTTARRTTTAQPGARAGRRIAEAPEQLTLLAPTEAPLQFRLDERTRRRGLANIALIRQQLAEQAERRTADTAPTRPAPVRPAFARRPAA